MLEVRSLTKRYSSIAAVDNVSFCVEPGQVLGYLGPNGSGKSTTVKIITGLLTPTTGLVLFQGQDIRTDLTAYKRVIGYVPEEANLYPFLSGFEYLELVGRLRDLPRATCERRIAALLQLFSLHSSRHSAMSTYSKGMRQRVLIISALLHNPQLIIFDEPLSGLDVTSALIFRNLTTALQREGKAIFYCSHVLEVVEKVCSHITILQRGKQVAYGSIDELRRFQAMPSLEAAFSNLVGETDVEKSAEAIVDALVSR